MSELIENIKPKDEETRIGIRKIKDYYFSVDERLFIPNSKVMVEIEMNIGFKKENNLVVFDVRVFYYYPEKGKDQLLVDIKVHNFFEVTGLERYIVNEKELELPENVSISLLSLSITHTRALLTKNTANTFFADTIFQIIDAKDVLKNMTKKEK